MAETSADLGIEAGADSVSGFVAYIAQFDAQFPHRIKGATEEEINQLEEIVRRPLPAEYRDFLRHMGNGYDRLIFAGECNASAFSISEYYKIENKYLDADVSEDTADEDTYDPPEGCLVIGAFCLSSDEVCLDLRREGTAPVIVMDDGRTVFYSASLIHLLYCRGYTAYRLPALPQFKFFTGSQRPLAKRESFERAAVWASAAPWSRLWFSDATCLCVEGEGIAFCLTFFDQTGYTLHLGGDHSRDLEETVHAISQVIGVPLTESSVSDD